MTGDIFAALDANDKNKTPSPVEQVRDICSRSEHEKKPEREILLKRACFGLFVGAIETGGSALEKKDFARAETFFSAAVAARPDSEWPLRQLAIAQAFNKERKAAVETLRRIKPADAAGFQKWLAAEPAFGDLRERQDLKDLLSNPQS